MHKPVILLEGDSTRRVSSAFGHVLNLIKLARCHKKECGKPCGVSLRQVEEIARGLIANAAPEEALELAQRIDRARAEGIFY